MNKMVPFLAFGLLSYAAAPAHSQFAPPDAGAGNIAPPIYEPTVSPPSVAPTPIPAPPPPTERDTPAASFRANQAYTINALIGYVNDQPIFANDVFRPIDADLRRLAAKSTSFEFTRTARALIERQLNILAQDIVVVSAAEATLTEQDLGRISVMINLETSALLSQNGGSRAAAEAAMSKEGSSLARALADKRRSLVRQFYFSKNLLPRIQVTRQMALNAYEADTKRWAKTAQIELYTITLPVSRWLREPGTGGALGPIKANPTAAEIADAERQAMTTAREIVTKLKAGGPAGDFARLAEDFDSRDEARSKGGRWGMINKGSMVNSKLEDFVFALPANQIGEPLLFHENDFKESKVVVAKAGQKAEARVVPFEEAQATLVNELRMQQFNELQVREIEKLTQHAAKEAVDRMINVVVDAAVTRYATR